METLLVQALVNIIAVSSTDVCVVYSFGDRHSKDILSDILLKMQPTKTFTIYHDRFGVNHCDMFVAFARDVVTFRQMFSRLEIKTVVNCKVFVHLLHNQLNETYAVLKESWHMHLINIVALITNPMGEIITAFTFYPYTTGHCDKPTPVVIARISNDVTLKQTAHCSQDFWFPDKLTNLNQCPLYVATVQRPPYMLVEETALPIFIDGHRFDDVGSLMGGLEGHLLQELSHRMGFSVMLNLADGRGIEMSNGTIDGMMGRVASGIVNLSIGMMGRSVFTNRMFRTSVSYYDETVLYALPPGRDYTALEKLLLPFRASLWVACGFCFVVASLLLWTLGWYSHRTGSSAPVLEMFSVFAGGGYSDADGARGADQQWLLLWLFVTLVLRTIYQGYMFTVMQNNAQVMPPDTLEDLLAEGYFFLLDKESIFFFSTFSVLQNRFKAVQAVMEPTHSLEILLHPNDSTRGGSIIFAREAILLFNALQRREHGPTARTVGISRDQLFTSKCVIFMPNETIFLEKIDGWLHRMSSSGFVVYAEERMMGPASRLVGDDGAVGVQRLYVAHLWGSFQLWMFGVMGGGIFFLFEICTTVDSFIQIYNRLFRSFGRFEHTLQMRDSSTIPKP